MLGLQEVGKQVKMQTWHPFGFGSSSCLLKMRGIVFCIFPNYYFLTIAQIVSPCPEFS